MSGCGAAMSARARTSTPSPARSASTSTSSAASPGTACAAMSSATARKEMLHDSTLLSYHSTLAQHVNRVAIGPGEAARRRPLPRQPVVSNMFARRKLHGPPLRQGEAEDMLGVVEGPGREAMAPLGVDLEGIDHVPAHQPSPGRIDSGLLHHFPR